MKDFEVCSVGTNEEIKFSRNLARSIEDIERQYPGVIPSSVMVEYLKLKNHYDRMVEYENG